LFVANPFEGEKGGGDIDFNEVYGFGINEFGDQGEDFRDWDFSK